MRNKIIIFVFLLLGGASFAKTVNLSASLIDPTPASYPLPKSPVIIPIIDLDDYVVTFQNNNTNFSLQLIDENDNVVYTNYVPSTLTIVTLPSWLSGDYEIQLIPDSGDYYFYGTINL